MTTQRTELTSEELEALVREYPSWSVENGVLFRCWNFRHFRAGFGFVAQAALLFERQDHHGDVELTFKRVTIRLSSHDVGGLTSRDARMVRSLERITTS